MKRTIALVASQTAEDGTELLTQRLRHLLERGWDAWLFCKGARWRDEPALEDPELRDRIEVAADAKADSSPFDAHLRSLRPDLVHFHSGHAARKGLRDGQLKDAKIALSLRTNGTDLMPEDVESGLLWDRADIVLFADRIALDRTVNRGCPADKAMLLERPVRLPGPERRRDPGNGRLRVLSAGPLVWQQGFEHSIHAIRLLLDQGVACEYRIVGDGIHDEAVAFARHQLGLHDHVHLVRPDGDGQLPDELRSADVFVDPAVADTTSLIPLATAQVHGVPFVATPRRPRLPADAGIEVPRRDPRAITTALARLAADPGLREEMGRRAARSHGAWLLEDHLAELERIYEAVLAGNAVAPA
jgi:glycosyltransferase involved in cell wall biosynthesis